MNHQTPRLFASWNTGKGLHRCPSIGRCRSLRAALLVPALCLSLTVSAAAHADCSNTNSTASANFETSGWGNSPRNTRYSASSTITASNVGQLELAWSFALEGGQRPHSYPVLSDDTLFLGTQSGALVALDRATGCTRWTYRTNNDIRSGITAGVIHTSLGSNTHPTPTLFFGTGNGELEAVEAVTGKLIWQIDARDHPAQFITGTPIFHEGRLYVPLSSREVGLAMSPLYGCCTSRGAVAAYDATTGQQIWRTHSIAEAPTVTGRRWLFIKQWGPSGAPVWSAPTIDTERNQLLFGSGENYSSPASLGSDSITALNLDTGERLWSQQYTSGDSFNMACTMDMEHPNCPTENGPDLDFGAPPIVARLNKNDGTHDVIIAGQKSGDVHAIDPQTGVRLWSVNIGRGGYLGGVHWGMASDEAKGLVYAPISDILNVSPGSEGEQAPGMSAIDINTGKVRWQAPSEDNCAPHDSKNTAEDEGGKCKNGYSAAPVANAELVFVGGLDGVLHALSSSTGAELWRFDSWRDYNAVNATDELTATGGAIDVHGPILAGDQMFVQSGYGSFGQQGGNALLAFKVVRK